jgi:serine/threonine-protein kinase RsbW
VQSVASIGGVGTRAVTPVSVAVPISAAAIEVLCSVAAAVAARTTLGFDQVDDLRLAVSEAAGRLLRASGGAGGALAARIESSGDGVRLELSLAQEVAVTWPPDPRFDALSWTVIEALVDDAREVQTAGRPCIELQVRAPSR